MSLSFVILVVGLVLTGSSVLRANKQKTETNFRHFSQSVQFARSGLTEALAWFRRQTSQPVLQFEPVVDITSDPPVIDSDDPVVGIVREFKIAGSVWGRYEVWKPWDADPDSDRRAWRQQQQVRDISMERGLGAGGTAWSLRCVGYVFNRVSEDHGFDEAPNHVMSTQILDTELLRLKLSPPGAGAICIQSGESCTVDNNGRVRGGPTAAGIYYESGTGDPTVNGEVTGTPGLSPSSFDGSMDAVFGAGLRELKSIADNVITAPGDMPSPLPVNSLIVADAGDLTFDATRPLKGTGILYIAGDLTILAGSNSSFSGLLYVDGDVAIEAPAEIAGTIIVTQGHSLVLRGTGDWVNVVYDEDVLNTLRQEIGQYRMAGAIRPAHGERP